MEGEGLTVICRCMAEQGRLSLCLSSRYGGSAVNEQWRSNPSSDARLIFRPTKILIPAKSSACKKKKLCQNTLTNKDNNESSTHKEHSPACFAHSHTYISASNFAVNLYNNFAFKEDLFAVCYVVFRRLASLSQGFYSGI